MQLYFTEGFSHAKHYTLGRSYSHVMPRPETMIKRYMNPLTAITNQTSKQKCPIKVGKPTDKSVVYVVECMEHKLIYIDRYILDTKALFLIRKISHKITIVKPNIFYKRHNT